MGKVGEVTQRAPLPQAQLHPVGHQLQQFFIECGEHMLSLHTIWLSLLGYDFILEAHMLNPTQIKADTSFREWLTSPRNAASPFWAAYLESSKTMPYPLLILTSPGRTPPTMHSPQPCHLSEGLSLLSRSRRQEMKTSQ